MPNDFEIDASQLRRLNKSLSKAGVKYDKGIKRLLKKVGVYVTGLAKTYCPESPTKAHYKSAGINVKSTKITTGTLRNSIRFDVGKDYVSINVPANSQGGSYAEKMHDEKGKTWLNRGLRTIEKGPKADDKFIFRAADDSKAKIDDLIDMVAKELINGIGL